MTLVPASVAAAPQSLTANYEDLRQNALGGRGGGTGLTLFLRGGMARWMDACSELAACPTGMKPVQQRAEELPALDCDLRAQVAILLAQMTLSAHTQGATIC